MSDFSRLLDTLREIGVPYTLHHDFPKERWQRVVTGFGFNLTSHAMIGIRVRDALFVFSTGQPHWTTYEDDPAHPAGHKGWGPDGSLLFTADIRADAVVPRTVTGGRGTVTGRAALERDAADAPWPDYTPRG